MAAFPEAHARFREQGVALTCLVDYPIVDDPAAVEILRDVGEVPRRKGLRRARVD